MINNAIMDKPGMIIIFVIACIYLFVVLMRSNEYNSITTTIMSSIGASVVVTFLIFCIGSGLCSAILNTKTKVLETYDLMMNEDGKYYTTINYPIGIKKYTFIYDSGDNICKLETSDSVEINYTTGKAYVQRVKKIFVFDIINNFFNVLSLSEDNTKFKLVVHMDNIQPSS